MSFPNRIFFIKFFRYFRLALSGKETDFTSGSVRKAIEKQQMVAERNEDLDVIGIADDELDLLARWPGVEGEQPQRAQKHEVRRMGQHPADDS